MPKVLIVTYYWPPAGGPGVQRVLKFAKYLPELGWEPIILTVKNGEFSALDTTMLDSVKDIKTYRVATIEPFILYKILTGKKVNSQIPNSALDSSSKSSFKEKISRFIRANLFIPDARMGWYPFAVLKAASIIKKENIDLILSSSPPQTVQMIARKISRISNVKWIADFRDPWSDYFRIKNLKRCKAVVRLDKFFEKRALQSANAVITATKSLTQLLSEKVENDFTTIANGFDLDDFTEVEYSESKKYRIVYTGNVSQSQNPHSFFQSIAGLSDDLKKKIELNFYGNVHDEVRDDIKQLGLEKIIILHGYLPHKEVVAKIQNADLLLLLIPQFSHAKLIVTGKIYEYLAAKKAILGIGDPQGDAAVILEKSGLGKMYAYNSDWDNIILKYVDSWERKSELIIDHDYIAKFQRSNLTKELVKVFERVL